MRMTGNTILITGGASGIGRGLAEAFHKLGNKVIIAGRREQMLQNTAAANAGMEWVQLDTSDPESVHRGAKELTGRFPDLNVVVNNAGVQRTHDFSAATGLDTEAANEEIATNIHGVLRVTDAFLSHLKQQPYAVIVNVTSGLAFVPLAQFPVYCATKAFVHSFTISLRYQLRESNVRVLELAPPWVKTDLDQRHPSAVPTGRGPMPLDTFIEETMSALASDAEQLNIGTANVSYGNGVGERFDQAFAMMNGGAPRRATT